MTTPLYQVDAFTDTAFHGNPAAVCLLEEVADPAWMQSVAAEMNLSETAFVRSLDPDPLHELRWFTPVAEVELCGHATLAAAHALWSSERAPTGEEIQFTTLHRGLLTCRHEESGNWIRMDFPADPPLASAPSPGLIEALGVEPRASFRASEDWLIEVADEAAVLAARPDFRRLGQTEARGVMVTAPAASADVDFVSRFFAPRFGVDEDPVTGSAHCVLAPFWGNRFGRRELVGYQASRRGGRVRVAWRGDRVEISGQAVTVSEGTLLA